MDKKKNILIVSASFYPQNSPRSFRTTELAIELARLGHNVTVYFPTNSIDYSSFEIEYGLKIKNLGTRKWKGITIKSGKLISILKRVLNRILLMLFEWPDIELMFIVNKALKTEDGYDMLISIAVPYPIHWGVAKARRKNHRIAGCWIADCGDPYMLNTLDSFRKLFYFKYVEKWFCKKADFITIPFNGAKTAYYPEFHNKIRIIPQGFRLENINMPPFKKATDYPVFAYAGGFIPVNRDPRGLLEFLLRCDRNFRFVIYTFQSDMLTPYTIPLKGKLEVKKPITREELLRELARMDFLVNFDNNTQIHLPSKLIDYAITGRPVLNITKDFDFTRLLDFMDGIYGARMELESPVNYDIKLVANKFLRLQINS